MHSVIWRYAQWDSVSWPVLRLLFYSFFFLCSTALPALCRDLRFLLSVFRFLRSVAIGTWRCQVCSSDAVVYRSLAWWVVVSVCCQKGSRSLRALSLFLGLPRVHSPQNKSLIGDSRKISRKMQRFSEIIAVQWNTLTSKEIGTKKDTVVQSRSFPWLRVCVCVCSSSWCLFGCQQQQQ